MKRILKIVAVLVVAFLVVLAGASVALHFLLPPEKAKAMVLKELTEHLRREVQVDGVSIGVISGLTLSNLRISESPNFSKGTFVSSEGFVVKVSLLPLLFHKIMLRELGLRRPVINVVRYKDGKTFNFSDLLTPATTAQASTPAPVQASMGSSPAPAASGNSFALLVSQADITNGEVKFVDESPARQSADISDIALKVRNASLVAPFNVQASLKAKSKGAEAVLQLNGEGEIPSGSVKIKNFSLTSGGSTISASGAAKQLRTAHPTADLKFDIKEFNLASLKPFMTWPRELKVDGPLTGHGTVKGDQQQMELALSLDASKTAVAYAPSFSKPAKTPMSLSFHGTLQAMRTLVIKELGFILGPLQTSAHGSVENVMSNQPVATIHLETNSFPVDQLLGFLPGALPPTIQVRGPAKLSADVSGTALSSGIKAKLDGSSLSVNMPNQFSKPAGTLLEVSLIGDLVRPTPAQQTMNFQDLSGALGGLKWSSKGSYTTRGPSSQIALTLKTNSFPLQEIASLSPAAAPYHPSGQAVLDARISGSAAAPIVAGTLGLQNAAAKYEASELSNINANASFTMQDVSLPKVTGKLNGSEFSMSLTGRNIQTQPNFIVDGNFSLLDLDKLLPQTPAPAAKKQAWEWVPSAEAAPAPPPPIKTSGHIVVAKIKHSLYQAQNLDLKWNLSEITQDLSRVSGTATLRQGAGQLHNVEDLVLQSKMAKILLFPVVILQKLQQGFDKIPALSAIKLPSFQTIPFNGIKGDYLLKSGVMDIQAFELIGRDLDIQTQGTAGLAGAQPLNLKVKMSMSSALVGGALSSLLQDSSGRATVNLTVGGTVAAPQVHTELQEVGKRAIQQIGSQFLKGLTQPSNANGNNNNAPDDQNNANNNQNNANGNQQNPADQLQKALKNIFH
jgi:hypothetical protein